MSPAEKDRLWLSSMEFCRKAFSCHQMPERSLTWRGYQLPLCARCTGLLLGHLAGVVTGLAADVRLRTALLMLPLAADALLQETGVLPSTNIRRVITGLLYGFAHAALAVTLIKRGMRRLALFFSQDIYYNKGT